MREAPKLTTDRLTLRAAVREDYETIVDIWSNPEVVRFIGGRAFTRHESWMRLLRQPGLWQMLGYGYWTVVETETDRMIGQMGFGDFKREISIDVSGIPEAGWVLHPDFHGKGFAREAMDAIINWGDRHLNAAQTCAFIDPSNTASILLAEKLGFADPQPAKLGTDGVLAFFRQSR